MKKFVLEFVRRGLFATGLGPIVLAIVYLILKQSAAIITAHYTCPNRGGQYVPDALFKMFQIADAMSGMNVHSLHF